MEAIDLLRFFTIAPQRPKPIYYILIGKRTFSNLFAGKKFHYLNYFHSVQHLNWSEFSQWLLILETKGFLQKQENQYFLTEQGRAYLTETASLRATLDYYDGLRLPKIKIALAQLHLAIQVISQYDHQVKQYIPISTDFNIQWQVRQWFSEIKHFENLGQRFELELTQWLEQLPEPQANFMAANFSGYQFGFSRHQLQETFGYHDFDAELIQLDAVAALFQFLTKQPTQWPLCRLLLPEKLGWQDALSQSTQVTYQYFKQGQSLAQISAQRQLKAGTIREHLLEVALLVPNFDGALLRIRNDLPKDTYFEDRLQEILELNHHKKSSEN